MAKRKNKIFTEDPIETPQMKSLEEQAVFAKETENAESLVENVPDDPTKQDLLEGYLSEISRLNAELGIAKQTIAELEAKVNELQQSNDIMINRIAEMSAQKSFVQQSAPEQKIPVEIPSKKNYSPQHRRNVMYSNNGYRTW